MTGDSIREGGGDGVAKDSEIFSRAAVLCCCNDNISSMTSSLRFLYSSVFLAFSLFMKRYSTCEELQVSSPPKYKKVCIIKDNFNTEGWEFFKKV
jgi:hypothetical protein